MKTEGRLFPWWLVGFVVGFLVVVLADEIRRGHTDHAITAYVVLVIWVLPSWLLRRRSG